MSMKNSEVWKIRRMPNLTDVCREIFAPNRADFNWFSEAVSGRLKFLGVLLRSGRSVIESNLPNRNGLFTNARTEKALLLKRSYDRDGLTPSN